MINALNPSSKRPVIIVYPTVTPESIVLPITICIFAFPLLALLIICCLRRRAKIARERDRNLNYGLQDHAVSLVRFTPIHNLTDPIKPVILRSQSRSQCIHSMELDTVLEETQTVFLTSPESPTNDFLNLPS